MNALDERFLEDGVIKVVELHVNAGAHSHASSILGRRSDAMIFVQTPDGTEVGKNKSLKAPLIAQHLLEQEGISNHWNAVDLVIGGHGRHRMSLPECGLKALEHDAAQLALTHVDG